MLRPAHPDPSLPDDVAVEIESLSKLYSQALARLVQPPVSITERLLGRRIADDSDEEDEEAVAEDLEAGTEYDYDSEELDMTEVTWALRDLSLRLERGHVVALVGPSGSGKTTLLNVLGGAAPPTSGRALVGGLVWPPLSYMTSFMDPSLTARQNAVLAARIANVRKRDVEPLLDDVLELVGWTSASALRPAGSAIRAIALATGLALGADVLLVDAPAIFGASDFVERCLERFGQLRERGSVILLEAPSQELLDAVCDQMLWLDGGRLVTFGSASELLPRYFRSGADENIPADDREAVLRGFTASVALLAARVESETGDRLEVYAAGEPLVLRVLLEVAQAPVAVKCTVTLTEQEGGNAFSTEQDAFVTLASRGFHDVTALLPVNTLEPGEYLGRVEIAVRDDAGETTIGRNGVIHMRVRGGHPPGAAAGGGAVEWAVTHRLESPV